MYFDRINKTICALATSSGSSIGIIRISGKDSFKIASSVCNVRSFEHMKARLVSIKDHGKTLEKCLMLPFKSPKSFTGEDVVELHIHGSNKNGEEIISFLLEKGAVLALRGEFSFRAVLNSKMELTQALALNTLITSSNPVSIELSRKAAFEDRTLKKLCLLLKEWEHFFVLTTAIIDFPDQVESELQTQALSELITNTEKYLSETLNNSALLEKTGNFSVLIAGKPNVGKSSLFNILINKDRAIVSDDAGTTRDYITDFLSIEGISVQIIDSAGLRDGMTDIEKQGINKSRKLIKHADLLILMFDGSSPLEEEDFNLLSETSIYSRVLIINKTDKETSELFPEEFKNAIRISCLEEKRTEVVIEKIHEQIKKIMPDKNKDLFFSSWQKNLSVETLELILELKTFYLSSEIEIINVLIKKILENIEDLTGTVSSHSVYDKIFSDFCLGK